jgi:hypothetical protein
MKKFLHIGCGPQNKSHLIGFNSNEWQETRFDIDESVNPDILGTLTDMSKVASESMDAIYSSHNIEHVYAHEVPLALTEFRRVLKPDGFVIITCPDLQSVCEAVANDKLLEPLYQSPAGPISPIDILYGHRAYMQQGNLYMAHKCGFTYSSLTLTFLQMGFQSIIGARRPQNFDLWIAAFKSETSESKMREIAPSFFP